MTGVQRLSWGIKRSFLNYVESLPDCMVTMDKGVVRNPQSGEFEFPLASREDLNEGYRLEFGGDLRIKAHGGMLLVIFMDPWLTVTGSGVELSVIDLMHWPDTSRREVIGHSPNPTGPEYPMVLAETAMETFNNVYQVGEALDPVRLV